MALRRWPPSQVVAVTFAVGIAVLAVAPLVNLIWIALQGDAEIWPHLAAHVIPEALRQTAWLLAGVAVVAAVIGVGTAWLVTTFDFPGRITFAWLLPLPLAIPTYIVAYVYVDILDAIGPVQSALRAVVGWRSPVDYWFPDVRSLPGAIFVMGFVLYPYVYLATRAMLQTQGASMRDAARVLGARPWTLARQITLPLARPALAVGVALVLLETLNDIGASEYLGVQTLTLSIFTTWLNRGSLPGAAQIACVMLVLVSVLIWLERYGRRWQSFTTPVQDSRIAARVVLAGRAGWGAAAACAMPVLLGFAVPFGYLLYQVVMRGLLIGFDPALIWHTVSTVVFAAAATALALALGFGAVLAVRLVPHPFIATCVTLGGIGYAIPGTVLALALLSPLVLIDDGLNWITRSVFGIGVGLVVAGSGAAVIIAYVTRFLAIATGFAQAGFARISTDFDDVARSLGAGPGHMVRTVHMPLAAPALWGAALLIFVDCLKELPATLLLRPLNVETLSTYIYQFATRGSFEEGSLAALLIVVVGIAPIMRITRFAELMPGTAGRDAERR
ncbi:MAG: ABC transporter permease subunit [Rhizobiales bacterium]|nr:ABC transporter permease subunit [Hyphomicrobiales bacterium]